MNAFGRVVRPNGDHKKLRTYYARQGKSFRLGYKQFSPMQQRYALPSPTCDKVMNVTASFWFLLFILEWPKLLWA